MRSMHQTSSGLIGEGVQSDCSSAHALLGGDSKYLDWRLWLTLGGGVGGVLDIVHGGSRMTMHSHPYGTMPELRWTGPWISFSQNIPGCAWSMRTYDMHTFFKKYPKYEKKSRQKKKIAALARNVDDPVSTHLRGLAIR